METTTKKPEAQGAKMAENDKKAEERNPSSSYTIKSLGGNIKKLEKLKMCTPEELKLIKDIHKRILERWIGIEMGM